MGGSRLNAILSVIVAVEPHETSALLHSSSCFFFILSAYFVVLPLRDEGAISLGLSNLPGLFLGSLVLTFIAAPLSTLLFSLPNLSKSKALVFIHRFFSVSLVAFFILWRSSSASNLKDWVDRSSSSNSKEGQKVDVYESIFTTADWDNKDWFYVCVRIIFFLWVALLNLIAISSTWARIIDVMDSESGSRLFGFIGAGATLGQLFGSLFATVMAWLGPYLFLFAALLMEFAAQSSKGISKDLTHQPEESTPIREADDTHKQKESDGQPVHSPKGSSPKSSSTMRPTPNTSSPKPSTPKLKPEFVSILDGLWLIMSSTYLLNVSLFLWLTAVVSSFFYFQKVNVIATTFTSSLDRRKLLAQINSFIAVFILAGQLTLTGRILTIAGVTIAICAAPFVAFSNLIVIAICPTWVAVAVSETLRKVVTYVMTRPARELLFTVVSQEEKYKAKVFIDVVVQRLGDATAAGMYKLLVSFLDGKTSTLSLYALPVCFMWLATAFHLGRRQVQLAKIQANSAT